MSREELLVTTLVGLADSLVDDFDVIDVLSLLSDRCVELFDVDAAGVMLAAPSGLLHAVASSSDSMRVLELFELQTNEGPCVDSYRSGTPIVNLRLSVEDGRWPRFTPRVLADGYRSVHALPLRLRGRSLGALNMFRIDTGALVPDDVAAAQALADIATITIVQHQAAANAATLNTQLGAAIRSRVIIEQAKGRISEATGLDMELAFQQLRQHARSHNLRLTELSRDIADGKVDAGSLDPLRKA
jgi:GAF domain-containing protein